MLSFFYDLKELPGGYDPNDLDGFAVFYFPETTRLLRSPPNDPETALPEASMRFWPAESLPSFRTRAQERLYGQLKAEMNATVDDNAYADLINSLFRVHAPTPDGPDHHIGGHSDNVQDDMQLKAQLVMNGLYCGDSSGYNDPRRFEL